MEENIIKTVNSIQLNMPKDVVVSSDSFSKETTYRGRYYIEEEVNRLLTISGTTDQGKPFNIKIGTKIVEDKPVIEVQYDIEEKKPYWKKYGDVIDYYKCSECNRIVIEKTNYCPHCGVKITEENHNNEH